MRQNRGKEVAGKVAEEKAPALADKLAQVPDKPGAYIFRDEQGRCLYVGKALVLRNRVRSYFQAGPKASAWTEVMARRIDSLDWIVTGSEVEALILENNLIKQYHPFFNIRLSDDKTYPYLKLTLEEEFPRLVVVRRPKRDRGRYFGPYVDTQAMRSTLRIIRRHFGLITCTTPEGRNGCLDLHLGRCLGPCVGSVTRRRYQRAVQEVAMFLEGRADALLRRLRARMQAHSKKQEFEKAARLRDQVGDIEATVRKQIISDVHRGDVDVLALAAEGRTGLGLVLTIREGKLISQDSLRLRWVEHKGPKEAMGEFVQRYYSAAAAVPPVILAEVAPEGQSVLEDWLSEQRGGKVRIVVPQRGEKRSLVAMAQENARLGLASALAAARATEEWRQEALAGLQRSFGLPSLPRRIEAYDISTVQGAHTTGSMVVFAEGQPSPKDYRNFKIRDPSAWRDDYAALREVIARRFSRPRREDARFATPPDLILIDGGQGQLSSALEALRAAGQDVACVSLAKKFETVYVSGKKGPVPFPTDPQVLRLLQQIRDEAHRFALRYHTKLRARGQAFSVLEEIPGVGPARRKALMRKFSSLKAIQKASPEDIAQVPGVDRATAERIYNFFHQKGVAQSK